MSSQSSSALSSLSSQSYVTSGQPPVPLPAKRPLSDYNGQDIYARAKRARNLDPLVRPMKHFGRVVEPFISIVSILQWGLARDNPSRTAASFFGDEGMSESDRHVLWHEGRLNHCFEQLIKLTKESESDLDEELIRNEVELKHLASKLEKARGVGRSDDTIGCKQAIVDWLGTNIKGELLRRGSKEGRGFFHDHLGPLLAPIDVNWDNQDERQALEVGRRVPRPDESPRFFWRDGAYTQGNFWSGFLRHDLAVKAFKHIFVSPTSAMKDETNVGRGRATKKGNAALNHMTAVTLSSIAYVHMHVHMSLSDSESFNRDDDNFSYIEFYNHLVRFLHEQNDGEHGESVDNLLSWWNRRIFPAHHVNVSQVATTHANSLSSLLSAPAEQEATAVVAEPSTA